MLGAFAVLLLLAALFGEDEKSTDTATGDTATSAAETATTETTAEPVAQEPVPVRVSNKSSRTVRGQSEVVIRGTAPTDAKVRVNGFRTKRDGRRFSRKFSLAVGNNDFRVTGYAQGYERFDSTIYVIRELSQAEKAEVKARKAAAKARKKQNFINSARTIPYNQLEKNPDKYEGEKVCYRGQIFQIQEDGSNGGIMLIAVTDEGYGIWDDNIWVNYKRSINSAEDDIISICGTVVGSKSYETQIGGETYVPEIDARYITE